MFVVWFSYFEGSWMFESFGPGPFKVGFETREEADKHAENLRDQEQIALVEVLTESEAFVRMARS